MPPLLQILLGSAIVLACMAVHSYVLIRLIAGFQRWSQRRTVATTTSNFRAAIVALLVILGSHTLQVYAWATAVWLAGALADYHEAIYFALVSYTTLGYGDVTLGEEFRTFGAMSSVIGILAFGMSTAFLVALFSRMFERKAHPTGTPTGE